MGKHCQPKILLKIRRIFGRKSGPKWMKTPYRRNIPPNLDSTSVKLRWKYIDSWFQNQFWTVSVYRFAVDVEIILGWCLIDVGTIFERCLIDATTFFGRCWSMLGRFLIDFTIVPVWCLISFCKGEYTYTALSVRLLSRFPAVCEPDFRQVFELDVRQFLFRISSSFWTGFHYFSNKMFVTCLNQIMLIFLEEELRQCFEPDFKISGPEFHQICELDTCIFFRTGCPSILFTRTSFNFWARFSTNCWTIFSPFL